MSIKKKLLLTNALIFVVMVILALGYNLFANALMDKFSVMETTESEIKQVSDVFVAATDDDSKAQQLKQLGYALSVYEIVSTGTDLDDAKLVKDYGYVVKGYKFTVQTVTPKVVMFSNKIMFESRQNGRIYAAVKVSTRESTFNLANSIAIAVMILACGIAVFFACYYQYYTIFPPLTTLRGGLKQVAAGNYSFQLRGGNRDEIGAVISDFELMRQRLADLERQKSEFDRQRGEIIAGISHDLKTPLTTIQGYTKGLLDGVANTPEKTERYLRTIYETALTMNALVNQLNEFSKMDIDTIEYSFRERDMVELLSDFAAIHVPIYATKGLVITTDFFPSPVLADIDKEQFLRVVQNILDNSVKYKDKSEGHALIRVYAEDANAVLEISDDGPGVSPHEINYIFESYYRGDPSRTNPTTGSGLGLSIVKTIITAHGGTVEAVNDNGLKIIIKIPQRRKRN
ncbi:MAG: HAMP domain-containing histidine kinase [Clostridia bacterium]|nr:HAMP domain-containing histidine kinase [Clostridia bacterium]